MNFFKGWIICLTQIVFYLNLFVFSTISVTPNSLQTRISAYINLEEGLPHYVQKPNGKNPDIFCYEGKEKHVSNTWETVHVSLDLNDDQYDKFEGRTPNEVLQNFKRHQSLWTPNIFPFWKRKSIKLDPFNSTCIGIVTHREYVIKLVVFNVDKWLLSRFILGVVLFLCAANLSNNQLFYYICGISFGICGSILIMVYFISRIFPNKPMMYGMTLGGWTLAIYFLQYLYENAKLIVLEYYQYVLGYIGISGLISFAICYRLGPLSNPRSKKLIQWSLQIVGLVLIFYSSYLYEVTYAIDLILLIFPVVRFTFLLSALKYIKSKLFRPKVKLLSKKEFMEQGHKETEKALEELRKFCSSPKCNQWKTMLKLKDPTRFAEFMEGSFHLSDDEVDHHNSLCISANGSIMTDDSDSDSFTEVPPTENISSSNRKFGRMHMKPNHYSKF